MATPRAAIHAAANPSRIAIVDIGSNSVSLSIIDSVEHAPHHFYAERVVCGLGKHIAQSGKLNPAGYERAQETLRRYARLIEQCEATHCRSVATAAVRRASDGPKFCEEVQAQTGLVIEVIDGEREAQLSATGVIWSQGRSQGVVCDIGGSSLEFCEVNGLSTGARVSVALGALAIAEADASPAYIDEQLRVAEASVSIRDSEMFLVGGGWRALMRVDMYRNSYPLPRLGGYKTTAQSLLSSANWIASLDDPQSLVSLTGISKNRASQMPAVAQLVKRLVHSYAPRAFTVSSHGLREGAAVDRLGMDLTADPLFRGALAYEAKLSRFPGFGSSLRRLLAPIFCSYSDYHRRLANSACLLHDVSWQIHTDFRSAAAFNWPVQSALLGLTHHGRVFLGVALSYRYKWANRSAMANLPENFLSDEEFGLAKQIGRGLRFGNTLNLAGDSPPAQLEISEGELVLKYHRADYEAIGGEEVEERLASLASACNLKAKLVLTDALWPSNSLNP